MDSVEFLLAIVERIEASFPTPAIFDADEVNSWPEGALEHLTDCGLLREIERAEMVICDGCELTCCMPVIVRYNAAAEAIAAFVVCDEEKDAGRVRIPPERLKRYEISVQMAAAFLSLEFGMSEQPRSRGATVSLGTVKGRYGARPVSLTCQDRRLMVAAGQHQAPLTEFLCWANGEIHLDRNALARLLNRKQHADKFSPNYVADKSHQKRRKSRTAARDRRISQEAKRLRAAGLNPSEIAARISKMPFLEEMSEPGKVPIETSIRRILYRSGQ